MMKIPAKQGSQIIELRLSYDNVVKFLRSSKDQRHVSQFFCLAAYGQSESWLKCLESVYFTCIKLFPKFGFEETNPKSASDVEEA